MSEQHRHLVEDGSAARACLLAGGLDAHNDVSEDVTGESAELAFVHRERQNVGRAIFMAIDLVQLMDVLIVG